MTALMILCAAAVLAGIGYWVFRAPPASNEAFHVVRCHGCEQKVRYPERKAGRMGHCPRCLRGLSLPERPRPLSSPRGPCRVGERLLRNAS
jgi:hypothetical protein